MHLDVGVPVWGEYVARLVWVRRPHQRRRTQPGSAVVGQQRPVGDQLVPVGRHGEVGSLARAQAEHQVPVTTGPASGEVPHGAAQRVAPPAQQHVPVHPGLIVGLVESERPGGSGIGQVDDVHAAGGRISVVGEGGAAGDHLRRIPVHVGPMLFQQFIAQCHRAAPVTVVAEELHATSLDLDTGHRGRWVYRSRVHSDRRPNATERHGRSGDPALGRAESRMRRQSARMCIPYCIDNARARQHGAGGHRAMAASS